MFCLVIFCLQGHVSLLSNPPQPEDAEILDEPDVAMGDPAPTGDGDASYADTGEFVGASVGGHPAVSEGDECSEPLRFKCSRSSTASGRVVEGAGDGLPPVF